MANAEVIARTGRALGVALLLSTASVAVITVMFLGAEAAHVYGTAAAIGMLALVGLPAAVAAAAIRARRRRGPDDVRVDSAATGSASSASRSRRSPSGPRDPTDPS